MKYLRILVSMVMLHSLPALAAPPVPCETEVGTVFPNVGTYVLAKSDSNFFLKPGQCLISPNRQYMAVLQAEDGNFVVYPTNSITPQSNLWNSKTAGNPKAGLLVQQDGHFVIYRDGGIVQGGDGKFNADPARSIFNSNKESAPYSDYFLIMQNDANLVLYRGSAPDKNFGKVWASSENPISRSYCVALVQGDGNVVFRKTVEADSPQKAQDLAQVILLQYNQTAISAFRASASRVQGGGC